MSAHLKLITRFARDDQLFWLDHRVVRMALLINKETKQTTLAPPTKLAVKIKVISVSGGQWKGCVVRTEDRALPIILFCTG